MLRAMARSAVHYLKKRGLTDVAIAAQVGCERRTVARVVRQPIDQAYQRRGQASRLAPRGGGATARVGARGPLTRGPAAVPRAGAPPAHGRSAAPCPPP